MDLTCPYCKAELIKGFIYGGRLSFKWYTEEMSMFAKYTIFGGEYLHENPKVICFRCKECKKIIIDLDELKAFGEK